MKGELKADGQEAILVQRNGPDTEGTKKKAEAQNEQAKRLVQWKRLTVIER